MAKHRTYSIAFKRQIAQEYHGGESRRQLSRRQSMSRNLIRIWVDKYEARELDQDVELAANLEAYEAKIAALERKLGQLTMELEFVKKPNTSHVSREVRCRPSSAARRSLHPARL